MSGHNKWSSIKHDKGIADARRGQLFTRITREIMVAVRQGGSNPDSNPRLRLAIQKARENSMPTDNIERAIKKGEGTLEGAVLSEFVLEGYGPGGAAVLVEVLTDNHNRAVQEIRSAFSRHGGSLGESGSAAWIFEQRGLLLVPIDGLDVDELSLQAIDAGAVDIRSDSGEALEVYTAPEDLEKVRASLEGAGIPVSQESLVRVPKTTVDLEEGVALQLVKLLDRLEGMDDVRAVYTNANFSDEVLAKSQD